MNDEIIKEENQEGFTFFKLPKSLITSKEYKNISPEAKLLYTLLLDRMGLSTMNDWLDENGEIYIFYTVEEAKDNLCCSNSKVIKLFSQLENAGLIKRKKQGQGKPCLIYVQDYLSANEVKTEFCKSKVKTSKKRNSRRVKNESPDLSKLECNNNDLNNTYLNNTETNHIYLSDDEIKDRICFPQLCERFKGREEQLEEIVRAMSDVLNCKNTDINIGKKTFASYVVKKRFLELEYEHIEYVIDMLDKLEDSVTRMDKYLQACLYNAPTTYSSYYENLCNVKEGNSS